MEFRDLPEGFVPYELGDSEEDLTKEEKFCISQAKCEPFVN